MTFYLISFVSLVLVIGYFVILHNIKEIDKKINMIRAFIEKLTYYIRSKGEDNTIYDWLTMQSDLVQSYLGEIGILQVFQPDSSPFIFTDEPLIPSLLPQLKNAVLGRNIKAKDHFDSIRQVLVRYIGILLTQKEDLLGKKHNPILWYVEGIKSLLIIPFLILNWVGLISSKGFSNIQRSCLFNLISTIVDIISLIASIITIYVEWDNIIHWIKNLF